MKILLISDIHSNYEALLAVAHDVSADEIFCLGDLVDFGPQPAECVQWVRHHVGKNCVLGNHDRALAFEVDCQSSPAFHDISELSRAMNRDLLHSEQIEYLQGLAPVQEITKGDLRFHLSHAAPYGKLYKTHLQPSISDADLRAEVGDVDAEFICCGHTHLPMIRRVSGKTFVNPGSIGLPLDGDPRASCAVVQDGKVRIRRVKYDLTRTLARLAGSGLPGDVSARLEEILRTGSATTEDAS